NSGRRHGRTTDSSVDDARALRHRARCGSVSSSLRRVGFPSENEERRMRKSLAFRKYRTSLALGVATAAVLLVQVSFGAPMVFVANLAGGSESPPTSSSGTGTAIVIL